MILVNVFTNDGQLKNFSYSSILDFTTYLGQQAWIDLIFRSIMNFTDTDLLNILYEVLGVLNRT